MRNFRTVGRNLLSAEKLEKVDAYRKQFDAAIADNLNTPKALAVVWEVVKSNIPAPDKYDLIIDFDEVLGLKLNEIQEEKSFDLPPEIQTLKKQRDEFRSQKKFAEADEIRKIIESKGYNVIDTAVTA